jgi:ribonuclease HII
MLLPVRKQEHLKLSGVDGAERRRLRKMTLFEREAIKGGYHKIAGIDEAGRGPLAGPVVAAACIIPKGMLIPQVDDSKKLSPQIRKLLFDQITSNPFLSYGVGIISSEEIDKINILQATILAMIQAIENMVIEPDLLFVDGMELKHATIPCRKIIQGDAKSQSIAAASVIAKETRDCLMREYHKNWPQYGFDKHKGYGTEEHRQKILEHGPCPIHRLTFKSVL